MRFATVHAHAVVQATVSSHGVDSQQRHETSHPRSRPSCKASGRPRGREGCARRGPRVVLTSLVPPQTWKPAVRPRRLRRHPRAKPGGAYRPVSSRALPPAGALAAERRRASAGMAPGRSPSPQSSSVTARATRIDRTKDLSSRCPEWLSFCLAVPVRPPWPSVFESSR
jgi:hypothetical protein